MKRKIKNKIRTWLIRKLGGFTEQNYIEGNIPSGTYNHCSFEVRQVATNFVPIEIRKPISNRIIYGYDYAPIYDDLAYQIGQYIVAHGLFREYHSERIDLESVEFWWTVWVADPKDMRGTVNAQRI